MKNNCSDIKHEACTGCSACQNICVTEAISMKADKDGFLYPYIDAKLCVNCGLCYNVCPQKDAMAISKTAIKQAYYGYNTNIDIQKNSSSGGIFNALATSFLRKGGEVYGAAFDYQKLILHHCSSKESGLHLLQKSKYVQSEVGLTFQEIKHHLKDGRSIFFVGTPCQCAGLKHYLGNDKLDNLLLCDFICHGVPPLKLLRDHIQYAGFVTDQITSIDFRPKKQSWVDCFLISSRKKTYSVYWDLDPYYWLFEKGISHRQSCFNCQYSNGYREADMTIADFWGYQHLDRSIYRKDGLSMVIAYNTKAIGFLESASKEGLCSLTPMDVKYSDYAFKKSKKDKDRRDEFFELYNTLGYRKAVKSYGFTPFKIFVKNVIRETKSKIRAILK